MITEKYIRPTRKDEGYTELYSKGNYIGYILQNRSKFRTVGENWDFVPVSNIYPHLSASNRDKIILSIINILG